MHITNEVINEIRDKIDIVDVFSKYVDKLEFRGGSDENYFCCCPYHNNGREKTPSMCISKKRQIYTCFACGVTGNVFTFVADRENVNFYDAIRLLVKEYNLDYDLGKSRMTKDSHAIDYEIYSKACKFYQNYLNTNSGKNAIEYLEKRQIDIDTIKKFQIGLSPAKSKLTDFLLGNNFELDKLIKLGITSASGDDIFINRIMFPLYDLEGKVIAFSGRIYNTKDNSKYVNTKETPIFKKGTILYNYHNAKERFKKNDSIIVMEGFMDVIRASTVGINNCIATMGTALTKQNAELLKKTANEIILCFDGDKAGEGATVRAIEVFKELDVSPKVVRLEEDLDPDEYILKYGYDKFKFKIDNPISAFDFLMEQHKEGKDLNDDAEFRKYIGELLTDLLNIDDMITVDIKLKQISNRYSIEYDNLKNEYLKLKGEFVKPVDNKKNVEKKETKKYSQYELASKGLLYYMLKDENIIKEVEEKIAFFPDNIIRNLANEMIYFYHKYGVLKIADFISYLTEKEEEYKLFKEIVGLSLNDEYNMEEIEDYIKVINSYPVKRKVNELSKKLREENDPLKQASILSEILSLKGVK